MTKLHIKTQEKRNHESSKDSSEKTNRCSIIYGCSFIPTGEYNVAVTAVLTRQLFMFKNFLKEMSFKKEKQSFEGTETQCAIRLFVFDFVKYFKEKGAKLPI